MTIWTEAQQYIRDYGRCSYSPTECLYLISNMLAQHEQDKKDAEKAKSCE